MIIYPFPESYERVSEDFEVKWENQNIEVYNCDVSAYPFNRVWPGKQRSHTQTEKTSFVSFGSDGEVTVDIKPRNPFKNVTVRPLARKINPVINENGVSITFNGPGQYSVEFDGMHNALTVFINPEKEFNTENTEVLYFPAGIHIFDERIQLKDNQTVFIDKGAVVYGSFNASQKKNISIVGYGIIDNSRMQRANEINGCAILDPNADSQTGNPVFLDRCENVLIDGVTIVDSSGWNLYIDGCKNVVVNNIKLIGNWRYNADGCDFCNCENAVLENSYLRTFDDCVTVKGFKLNNKLPVCNIEVKNCVLWCDWGRALEVGVETCAPYISDIVFRDCDIIHGSAVMLDVQHGDASDITNVSFENINIEYSGEEMPLVLQESDESQYPFPEKYYPPVPFYVTVVSTMWSIDKNSGNIKDIRFKNIYITTPGEIPGGSGIVSEVEGSRIESVAFENIFVNGKKCNADDLGLFIGENVSDIRFG